MARGKEVLQDNRYSAYLATPLIKAAVSADSEKYHKMRAIDNENRKKGFSAAYGVDFEQPIRISPSIASECFRWWGYEILGYEPRPNTFESELSMMAGSAFHSYIERKLAPFGKSEETITYGKNKEISGRLDFFMLNPKLKVYQIWDFKLFSSFAFNKLSKADLPEELKDLKTAVQPNPEHRLQILTYMAAKRAEGKEVDCGNVIYINRDTWDMKEGLVFWDENAERDVAEFVEKGDEAFDRVKKGELPEPSVVSPYICGSFCPFNIYCDYGKQFASENGAKKKGGNGYSKMPRWLKKKIEVESDWRQKEREEKLARMTSRQESLFDFSNDGFGSVKKDPVVDVPHYELETPLETEAGCGDCGANLMRTWHVSERPANHKGFKYIYPETWCPSCGSEPLKGDIIEVGISLIDKPKKKKEGDLAKAS